jgi:hypothetical protein
MSRKTAKALKIRFYARERLGQHLDAIIKLNLCYTVGLNEQAR